MSEPLLPTTEAVLRTAGWRPDRKTDLIPIRSVVEGEGYVLPPAAEAFLGSFGNLTATFDHPAGFRDSFHLFADRAALGIRHSRVSQWERIAGLSLVPIGEWSHMTLLMDPVGQVYGGFDDVLVVIGKTGTDALNALVMGSELVELGRGE